ncbi:unnamed protein product [Calypogeia fissa]
MADFVMTECDSVASPHHFGPVEVGSPMHINMECSTVTTPQTSPEARTLLFPSQFAVAGGSPGKYVSPRLRRTSLPASPTTFSTKRPLSMEDPLNWRTSPAFRAGDSPQLLASLSPSNRSPPPQGACGALGSGFLLDRYGWRYSTWGFFRSSNSNGVFDGARIKHGSFSAASLSASFQDHSDRGVILSFTQRAPSYDHFRVWLDTHLSQAGILIDNASQLGNDFFLLLLHDQANQKLVLKQKLFFLNKYVDIFPWTPAFAPQELSNKTRPIWVELTNLHPSLRLRSLVEEVITSNLGHVLYFPETKTLVHHTNPRILIRWTMLEDIIDFLSLDDQGDVLLQQVTFLNHPDCCHNCKRPGHLMKECTDPSHFRNDSRNRLNQPFPPVALAGDSAADPLAAGSGPDPLIATSLASAGGGDLHALLPQGLNDQFRWKRFLANLKSLGAFPQILCLQETKMMFHPVQRRPPTLSFPAFILERDDFQLGLQAVWLNPSPSISLRENWDLNIAASRSYIKQYVKSNRLQGHHIPL